MKWRRLSGREREMVPPETAEFERVMLPHLDCAHNLARWLVRDPSLGEDVVQDAMLRAFSHFGSFRGNNARAWLLRIVRNVAYDALAARRRRGSTSLDDGPGFDDGGSEALQVPDPSDDPEAALTHRERHASLERALAGLPLELRECLVLRELDELSYKEVAHITGVPIGTVMSRLWRARQTLLRGHALLRGQTLLHGQTLLRGETKEVTP